MSALRFCAHLDDLMRDFAGRPALTPLMSEIISSELRKPIGVEVNLFNTTLYSLEKNSNHFRRRDPGRLDDGGVGWIEYLDMQYGLTSWLDEPAEFEPLTWLALAQFLFEYQAPYPKSLIATVEYFLADWDAEAYAAKLGPTAPTYVREHIVALSIKANRWMSALEASDVY